MSNSLTIAAVVGAAILVWVLILYRRGRLKEDHALLWIAVSVAIILLSTWMALLIAINQLVGAAKASDVALAAFVAFLIVVSIYYSVKISMLEKQNRIMAQEIAVMKMSPLNPQLSIQKEKEAPKSSN